jgi:hypothetical protein
MAGGRTVTQFPRKLVVTDSPISGSRFEQQTAIAKYKVCSVLQRAAFGACILGIIQLL